MGKGKMSSLEERLGELEQLTARLESGELSLDESIQAYTEGMKIAVSCKKSLDEMSEKIAAVRVNTQKILSGGEYDGAQAEEDVPAHAEPDPVSKSDDLPF